MVGSCVAGDITGDQKSTLGDFLKNTDLLGGLRKTLEGIWAYANNEGARHGKEGREPGRDEAEFVVTIVSAAIAYLLRKHR